MKFNQLESVCDDLNKYDILAKKEDFIQVTAWNNREGYDITINNKQYSFTSGQLDAIDYLIKSLQYYEDKE